MLIISNIHKWILNTTHHTSEVFKKNKKQLQMYLFQRLLPMSRRKTTEKRKHTTIYVFITRIKYMKKISNTKISQENIGTKEKTVLIFDSDKKYIDLRRHDYVGIRVVFEEYPSNIVIDTKTANKFNLNNKQLCLYWIS